MTFPSGDGSRYRASGPTRPRSSSNAWNAAAQRRRAELYIEAMTARGWSFHDGSLR